VAVVARDKIAREELHNLGILDGMQLPVTFAPMVVLVVAVRMMEDMEDSARKVLAVAADVVQPTLGEGDSLAREGLHADRTRQMEVDSNFEPLQLEEGNFARPSPVVPGMGQSMVQVPRGSTMAEKYSAKVLRPKGVRLMEELPPFWSHDHLDDLNHRIPCLLTVYV
jgi:hypothetical protein